MKNNSMNALNDQELENVVGGISQNEAFAAALNHAGIPAGSAMMKKCELDYEWGKQVYEIEFYFNGMEYEYKIDSATGAIVKAKKEWDD